MYDIRHRLIWAISGFVSAVSLLVLVTLAGYGLFKALLLSALILALVALILWILWVSEPESLVDILAPPPAKLPPPAVELPPPAAAPHAAAPRVGAHRAKSGARGARRTAPLRGREAASLASAEAEGDDLFAIDGIDARAAALLDAEGITRFEQIAGLAPEAVSRIEAALAAPGRIAAERWREQARALLAAGDEEE